MAQLPYAHGTTSPGYRAYSSLCLLTNTPSNSQINKGQTLTGDWLTIAGSSCNGVGYAAATAGTVGGIDNFNVASTVEFDDAGFAVPNVGQSYTMMTLSGDYFVLGYIAADGLAVGPSSITTSGSLTVKVLLQQTSLANPGTWSQIYYWTLHGSGDWVESCGIAIAQSCAQWTSMSGGLSFSSLTYGLAPGYEYRIGLQFQPRAIVSTFAAATGLAMTCGDDTKIGFGYDDCTSVPPPINGGNLPVQPGTSCPSGTSTNPCFYVQWVDSTTTLVDTTTGGGGGCISSMCPKDS